MPQELENSEILHEFIVANQRKLKKYTSLLESQSKYWEELLIISLFDNFFLLFYGSG